MSAPGTEPTYTSKKEPRIYGVLSFSSQRCAVAGDPLAGTATGR
jgi:hypothetical protein